MSLLELRKFIQSGEPRDESALICIPAVYGLLRSQADHVLEILRWLEDGARKVLAQLCVELPLGEIVRNPGEAEADWKKVNLTPFVLINP
jgi:hypothetical protein